MNVYPPRHMVEMKGMLMTNWCDQAEQAAEMGRGLDDDEPWVEAELIQVCESCGPTDDPTCFVECVCQCHDDRRSDDTRDVVLYPAWVERDPETGEVP